MSSSFKQLGDLLSGTKWERPSRTYGSSYHRARKLTDVFDFLQLIRQWEHLVGPRLAQHSIPIKIRQQTLHILVDHSSFASTLTFVEREIIKKVEDNFSDLKGKIKSFYFLNNADLFKQKSNQLEQQKIIPKEQVEEQWQQNQAKHHPFSPLMKKWKQEATELFSHIEDPLAYELLCSIYIQQQQSKKD